MAGERNNENQAPSPSTPASSRPVYEATDFISGQFGIYEEKHHVCGKEEILGLTSRDVSEGWAGVYQGG